MGGGSVLLGVLQSKIKIKGTINAYDLNGPLIGMYKNIQSDNNYLLVCSELDILIDLFNGLPHSTKDKMEGRKKIGEIKSFNDAKDKEEFYYCLRQKYNELSPNEKINYKGSAYLIFLNRTCFRGVFRMGPYGHYNNPYIYNKTNIKLFHDLVKNVNFIHKNCFDVLNSKFIEYDFIYLDPPYALENPKSFVGYTSEGFDSPKLFQILKNINIDFVMSNSSVPLVEEYFTNNLFEIKIIECKRSINSKDPSAKTNEVLVNNFSIIDDIK